MKSLLSIGLVLFASTTFAQTVSENRAVEMINVLQNAQIKSLLAAEDGVGTIESVRYVSSMKMPNGPARYEVKFRSGAFGGNTVCRVPVSVDMITHEVIGLEKHECVAE